MYHKFKCKNKSIKEEKNVREKSSGPGIPKAQPIKEKSVNWISPKLKIFALQKRMRRE